MANSDVGIPIQVANASADVVQVPLVHDTLSFDGRQALSLKDMEKRVEAEMKRKKRSWEKEVERMRQEFLHLYPTDRVWGSDELLHDPLVAKRRGSTDILDPKKMKTLFLDYPDTGKKYRIRFDVSGFDPETIRVSTDGDRIVIRATKREVPVSATGESSSTSSLSVAVERKYERKIQKPKDVDHTKFKSYLTSDSILIVEAPVHGRTGHHDLRRTSQSPASSHHSSHAAVALASPARSRSPSNSPGQETPSKEKIGVPAFRDENGQRRLQLVVDMGAIFKPQDITIQVIKDNKILIWAKHEEKTTERLTKSKFTKEYELSEKIETYSLNGVLASDGRLTVGAFAKGHGADKPADEADAAAAAAAAPAAGDAGAGGSGTGKGEAASSKTAQPCNDLEATSA